MGKQRATDRDALAFAAGQRCRKAAQQPLESEQLNDVSRLDSSRGLRCAVEAVQNVRFHAQMRKEQVILENIAQASSLRREIDAAITVEQGFAVDDDVSPLWPAHSCKCVYQGGLSGAGATEQAKDGRFRPEGN